MENRYAEARWEGDLKSGRGRVKLESGLFEGPYSYHTRFQDDRKGTNPEELIGAAHAGCFAMATSAALSAAGHPPHSLEAKAVVTLAQAGAGFEISRIALTIHGDVPGIDEAEFVRIATDAKQSCPISKALGGVKEIVLDAKLVAKSGAGA